VGVVSASGAFELEVIPDGVNPDYYKHTAVDPLPGILWRPHWSSSTETLIIIEAWSGGTGPYTIFEKVVSGIWVTSFTDGDYGGTGTVVITNAPSGPAKATSPTPSHQAVDIILGYGNLSWQAG